MYNVTVIAHYFKSILMLEWDGLKYRVLVFFLAVLNERKRERERKRENDIREIRLYACVYVRARVTLARAHYVYVRVCVCVWGTISSFFFFFANRSPFADLIRYKSIWHIFFQLLDTLPVCQDFNRQVCNRPACKFIHLSDGELFVRYWEVRADHAHG